MNVSFTKARVTVSGRVECIETPCDPSISVALVADGHQNRRVADVSSTDNGSSVFEFTSVVPGLHKLSVNQDAWCWEQQTIPLQISAEPVSQILFKQSGYIMNAILSHDIHLVFSLEKPKNGGEEAQHTFKMTKGSQNFCLSKPGLYKITPRSCYLFQQDAYQYDTSAPRVLDFDATHYLVTGTVETARKLTSAISILVEQHKNNKPSNADTPPKTVDATFVESTNSSGEVVHSYKYTYWATLGESVELIPQHPSLMFYPRSMSASVTRNECPQPLGAIQARDGLHVQGEVAPAIEGVSLAVDELE